MSYYNYHATVKRLIREGKLTGWYVTERHRTISPALVLCFDDEKHPIMPIREAHFEEYWPRISHAPRLAPPNEN